MKQPIQTIAVFLLVMLAAIPPAMAATKPIRVFTKGA
jgi:hypothetical protein